MADKTVDKSIRDYVSRTLAEIAARDTEVLWRDDTNLAELFVEDFCEGAINLAELAARWEADKEGETVILEAMATTCDGLAAASLLAGRGTVHVMQTYAYLLWQGPPEPTCDTTGPRFDLIFANLLRSLPLGVLSLCEAPDQQFTAQLRSAKRAIEQLSQQD